MQRRRTHNTKKLMIPALDGNAIGARVQKVRIARRWTQVGLANVSGLSKGCIICIENGLRRPSLSSVIALAYALKRSIEWILYGVPSRSVLYRYRIKTGALDGREALLPKGRDSAVRAET